MVNEILQGDSLEVLKTIPDESVDCVVTSPPYWALRDYGVEGQFGLEPTFQEYINKLCDMFDEVKRVLKKEGTCFVNIGDTYSGAGAGQKDTGKASYGEVDFRKKPTKTSLPDKSLCQIPNRFAIEMCNRGWILRNEIIWFKRNCMPSSVKDRFTVDFEKVFFFVKNKKYYFEQQFEHWTDTNTNDTKRAGEFIRYKGKHEKDSGNKGVVVGDPLRGRNKRTVWDVTTKGFKGAHFATFPPDLIEPMILAGCPKEVCQKCGEPREKIFERINKNYEIKEDCSTKQYAKAHHNEPIEFNEIGMTNCGCNVGFTGGIVLDPFMGAGTTAVVAKNLGRNYLGIELNPEYIKIAQKRIDGVNKPLI